MGTKNYLLFCLLLVSTNWNMLFSLPNLPAYKIKKVVLDAGHGGRDTGCHGNTGIEKQVTLAITKKLGSLIQQFYPEIELVYTREKDVFVSLDERSEIANREKADLFISIHCNAIVNASNIHGTETYILSLERNAYNLEVAKRENASILYEENYQKNKKYTLNPADLIELTLVQNGYIEQSTILAQKIEEQFKNNAKRRSIGVKQAGFFVLRETACPSVLVETGFLTNPSEDALLSSEEGQDLMATCIFNAFSEYKGITEGIAVTTLDTETSNLPSTPEPVRKAKVQLDNKQAEKTSISGKSEPKSKPMAAPAPKLRDENMVEFKVQLAASPTAIDMTQGQWKKVKKLEEHIENNAYKYLIGGFFTQEDAINFANKMNNEGFKGAFVVAYNNGRRISIQQAKDLLKKNNK